MRSQQQLIANSYRPLQGQVAFAHAAAMKPSNCKAPWLLLAGNGIDSTIDRMVGGMFGSLDRTEDRWQPGEGSA